MRLLIILAVASAVATFGQSDPDPTVAGMIDDVSEAALVAHIDSLQRAGGHWSRVNFTPGNDSGYAYIIRALADIDGDFDVELDTFFVEDADAPYDERPLLNIVATFPGAEEPETVWLLGAHTDASASREGSSFWENNWETTRAPGADDNGTGVAALLEIARILSDSATGYENEKTIKLVFFGAEESGPAYGGHHYGSLHYAEQAADRGEDIFAATSVDMIGYNTIKDFQSLVVNDSSVWIAQRYAHFATLYDLGLYGDIEIRTESYSDHESFWRYGYDAALLIEYAWPWNSSSNYSRNYLYHTQDDTLGSLNMSQVVKVTKMTLATTAEMCRDRPVSIARADAPPDGFRVAQNYPNPFNPTTTIEFELAEAADVRATIYNALGEVVAVVAEGGFDAGVSSVRWNASDLPAGAYVYEIRATSRRTGATYREARKALLLK
jgi:hypothetical protein